MISTMRERMSAKMGNSNDNAFKMRKLFKMYDKADTGMVSKPRAALPMTRAPPHHISTHQLKSLAPAPLRETRDPISNWQMVICNHG